MILHHRSEYSIQVLPGISEEFLPSMMAGEPIEYIHVNVQNGEFGFNFEWILKVGANSFAPTYIALGFSLKTALI